MFQNCFISHKRPSFEYAAHQMILFLLLLQLFYSSSPVTANNHNAITQRPLMINQLNMQRSALKLPLLCQDSLLTSMAQQHANDMAALDQLGHDLPCDTSRIPNQFCLSASRMSGFGKSAENVFALARNGTAVMAMMQVDSDSTMYSNAMNKDFLYVGVGVAYNATSHTYYWTQLFSTGDYVGVSCTLQPLVRTINGKGKPWQYLQPQTGLNPSLYPGGISSNSGSAGGSGRRGYYCTLIAYDPTSNATLTQGSIPYPTILIPPPQGSHPSPVNSVNQTAQQQAIAQQAIQAAMAYYNRTGANSTGAFNATALNSTLEAVGSVVKQNTTLMAGLNGTDSGAMSMLYSQVTSIIMIPSTTSTSTSSSE